MTDIRVGIRLDADGKGFRGEMNISRQDLEKLTASVRQGEQEGRRYTEATREVERSTRRAGRSFLEAHGQMVRYVGSVIGVHQLVRAFRAGADATLRQEDALRQVEARIQATGGAAGVTTREMAELATSLQRVTTYGDEQSLEALGRLISFRGIGGAEIRAALPLVQDLATALGQDLNSAAIQLGKALNDPARGLTALSRSGTTFTAAQQDLILSLHETGREAEAQRLILDEVRRQYDGAARAARETLGGALDALRNAFMDLTEVQSSSTESLRQGIEGWAQAVERVDVRELHASIAALGLAAAVPAGAALLRLTVSLGAAGVASLRAARDAAQAARSLTRLHQGARAAMVGLRLLSGPVGWLTLAAAAAWEMWSAVSASREELRGAGEDARGAARGIEEAAAAYRSLSAAARERERDAIRARRRVLETSIELGRAAQSRARADLRDAEAKRASRLDALTKRRGAAMGALHEAYGLSPRVRGNQRAAPGRRAERGSIPASAGEPPRTGTRSRPGRVYPRECGGTPPRCRPSRSGSGLSPRVRGNPRNGGADRIR